MQAERLLNKVTVQQLSNLAGHLQHNYIISLRLYFTHGGQTISRQGVRAHTEKIATAKPQFWRWSISTISTHMAYNVNIEN
jgi:RsiW-degrading membrane proteinase PrsW (M82 family)